MTSIITHTTHPIPTSPTLHSTQLTLIHPPLIHSAYTVLAPSSSAPRCIPARCLPQYPQQQLTPEDAYNVCRNYAEMWNRIQNCALESCFRPTNSWTVGGGGGGGADWGRDELLGFVGRQIAALNFECARGNLSRLSMEYYDNVRNLEIWYKTEGGGANRGVWENVLLVEEKIVARGEERMEEGWRMDVGVRTSKAAKGGRIEGQGGVWAWMAFLVVWVVYWVQCL